VTGTRDVSVSAPRQRVLLAALLLGAGRVVSLDALAEVLWKASRPRVRGVRCTVPFSGCARRWGPSGAGLVENAATWLPDQGR